MFSSAFFPPFFPPRMSRRVCWGNPKGLSQRSHLFRRLAPLWKGCVERSAGISWGSCWAILRCSAMTKQPRGPQAAPAGLGSQCLLWEDFKPCAATKISVVSGFVSFPLYDRSRSYRSCRKQRQSSRFVSTGLTWPSLQMRAQGGFLRCCVCMSSLAAPWLPVSLCQGRTTS